MSDSAALFALYESLWRGEGSAWSDGDVAFTPFDDYAILREQGEIRAHWNGRRAGWALAKAEVRPLVDWRECETALSVLRAALTLRPRDGRADQRRDLRLVIGARQDGARWKLVHLAEAPAAALVDMIVGYQAEAAGRVAP
jgi:hypothetical protein